MRSSATLWKTSVFMLMLALLAIPAVAQDPDGGYSDSDDALRSSLRDAMQAGMGQLAVGFWEPRLDAYKVRIDKIFSSRDLPQLNELRVRFAMIMAQARREDEQRRSESRYSSQSAMDTMPINREYIDTVVATETFDESDDSFDGNNDGVVVEMRTDVADEAEITRRYQEELQQLELERQRELEAEAEMARRQQEMERQAELEHERELDAREEALARGETVEAFEGEYGPNRDMVELPAVAKWLARNYRSQLDQIAELLMGDLKIFIDTVTSFRGRFVTAHASELQRVPDMVDHLDSYLDIDKMQDLVKRPLSFRLLYTSMLEPFLLLYSGEGLSRLLGSVSGAGTIEHLPESSMLQQNTPNPASTFTTIPYTLAEPGTQTTIRIFNARGEVVMELDQEEQAAGAHQVKVDVSSLPSGSYLYQLTVTGSSGQKVSAMVMQITK